jgi:3-phenylpropionate/cinnamic acid dioxygenase small subunit
VNQQAASVVRTMQHYHDDWRSVMGRIVRLTGTKSAWAEDPPSRTRRLVTNVRVSDRPDGAIGVKANFVVYRTKGDRTVQYMGEAHYLLVAAEGAIRIRRKRCNLDLNSLADQGRLTIIL